MQKLLLFVGATEKAQVCEIVATRSKDGKSLDVAVTFLGFCTESPDSKRYSALQTKFPSFQF